MPTYPLATLGITIGPGGATGPEFQDIILSMIAIVQSIYGSDVYLDESTQDYQLLAAFSQAIYDSNAGAISAYNSLRPTNSVGAALSSLVKVGGITRNDGSNSTAVVAVGGTAGTPIDNGIVQDSNGNLWTLPASVVIPISGVINVTGTSITAGNIAAPSGAVKIYTPVRGWQTASFVNPAAPGNLVESDGLLRIRFSASYQLPALTPLGAIQAAIGNIMGIGRTKVYENQYTPPDGNGIPGHTIAAVVEGGDVDLVGAAIQSKKSPGTGTYGTTQVLVPDEQGGTEIAINFFELTEVSISVVINATALNGFVASTAVTAAQAVADFITALGIGLNVFYNWVIGAATLYGSPLGLTYDITSLTIGITGGSPGTTDIPITFIQAASCIVADVTFNVS